MPDLTVLAGSIMIFLGFLLVAAGILRSMKDNKGTEPQSREKSIKGGGVILIGPVPVVFGTDKKYTILIMVLAIIIMLLALVFRL